MKKTIYKVGQIVRNKRSKLVRRITRVSNGRIFWTSKNGGRKGVCDKYKLTQWIAGKDK